MKALWWILRFPLSKIGLNADGKFLGVDFEGRIGKVHTFHGAAGLERKQEIARKYLIL
jgi:hypothetical protein